MAEIKITKKRVIWPYVVALLIVVAAVLYYLYYTGNLTIKDDMQRIGTDVHISNGTSFYIPGAVKSDKHIYSLI